MPPKPPGEQPPETPLERRQKEAYRKIRELQSHPKAITNDDIQDQLTDIKNVIEQLDNELGMAVYEAGLDEVKRILDNAP